MRYLCTDCINAKKRSGFPVEKYANQASRVSDLKSVCKGDRSAADRANSSAETGAISQSARVERR